MKFGSSGPKNEVLKKNRIFVNVSSNFQTINSSYGYIYQQKVWLKRPQTLSFSTLEVGKIRVIFFGTCPANAGNTGIIPKSLMRFKICVCRKAWYLCQFSVRGPDQPWKFPIRFLKRIYSLLYNFSIDLKLNFYGENKFKPCEKCGSTKILVNFCLS